MTDGLFPFIEDADDSVGRGKMGNTIHIGITAPHTLTDSYQLEKDG